MVEFLLNWFGANYPQLVGFLVLAIVFIAVGMFISNVRNRFKKVENTLDELECSSHAEDIQKLKSKEILPCKEHSEIYHSIKVDLARIEGILTTRNPKMYKFSAKHSPRQLNEDGLKVFNEIKGQDFLNANFPLFEACIDKKQPKTPLDVETYSLEVLIYNLNLDIFNSIKNWVYNSPAIELEDKNGVKSEYSVTISDVCFILSLPLRNMYLDKHPELKSEE